MSFHDFHLFQAAQLKVKVVCASNLEFTRPRALTDVAAIARGRCHQQLFKCVPGAACALVPDSLPRKRTVLITANGKQAASGHIVANGSVLSAGKRHQTACLQICLQTC